ncbi:hypothetical protein [Flavobacterium sp. '19STA2R22 D10 B1']|uniref:hypothetical protein n=1 Tax=Flavobacterium aerium TaxID=3037261 RepID=UPI00278BD680|nr:hypothetical protein [Flavobacterium sp. '19STA2R22 D10 B1']
MKKYILLLFLMTAILGKAQNQNLNAYKYVLVPMRFEFFKEDNKFQLNILTKFLLKKYGFEALMLEENLPNDITGNRCNSLIANVVEENNFLVTKLKVTLKDCYGKIIYESKVGKSKAKDYKTAYTEALREAFTSFETVHYAYDQNLVVTPAEPVETTKPVQKVNTAVATTTVQATENTNSLFAQPITNGYQLVDSTPKIVLKMYKTSQSEVYIATSDSYQGVVYKQNNQWILEYYKDQKLMTESLSIKF